MPARTFDSAHRRDRACSAATCWLVCSRLMTLRVLRARARRGPLDFAAARELPAIEPRHAGASAISAPMDSALDAWARRRDCAAT